MEDIKQGHASLMEQSLRYEIQELRQREAVNKILYEQLLEAYNNVTEEKGNRANSAILLMQLHQEQKSKMRIKMQQQIESRLNEYTQLLIEMNDAREAKHSAESKQLILQQILERERTQSFSIQMKFKVQIDELQHLNRQLRDSQQIALNKLICKHNEEIREMKSKLQADSEDKLRHVESIFKLNRQKLEQSVNSYRQQLETQQRTTHNLQESVRSMQQYLINFQHRTFLQKSDMSRKIEKMEEERTELLKECSLLKQNNIELRERVRLLDLEVTQLTGNTQKLEQAIMRLKKNNEREAMKERSLSARLMKEVGMQQKQLKSRQSEEKLLMKRQREKEKQLLDTLADIKNKYERQKGELMDRLMEAEREKKERKLKKISSSQIILTVSGNNEASAQKMLPDVVDGVPTSKMQDSQFSTRHPTFENMTKEDEPRWVGDSSQPATNRKRHYRHLRINSDFDTVRQQNHPLEFRRDVETPCFQTSSKASLIKPNKQINIRLKK